MTSVQGTWTLKVDGLNFLFRNATFPVFFTSNSKKCSTLIQAKLTIYFALRIKVKKIVEINTGKIS